MNRLPAIVLVAVLVVGGCAGLSRPPQFIGGTDLAIPTARANGVEGRMVVRYDVTAQGKVVNAVVQEPKVHTYLTD